MRAVDFADIVAGDADKEFVIAFLWAGMLYRDDEERGDARLISATR